MYYLILAVFHIFNRYFHSISFLVQGFFAVCARRRKAFAVRRHNMDAVKDFCLL